MPIACIRREFAAPGEANSRFQGHRASLLSRNLIRGRGEPQCRFETHLGITRTLRLRAGVHDDGAAVRRAGIMGIRGSPVQDFSR